MFQIIASDLDGTLLTPDQQITPFTKKILQLLTRQKNIHFVFATGRHYINVKKIRENLRINSYTITSNGARIHDMNGKLIDFKNLNKKIAHDLINIAYSDPKIITNIFRDNEWFINQKYITYKQKVTIQQENISYQIYQPNTLSLNGICKVYFSSNDYQRLLSLEKKLYKKWGNQINISFSLPTCLEVMPEGISKGHALKKVAELLGYQLKDCISFGDGMNDKEMLSMTGKGCIMSNAQQQLKNILPELEIIGSNTNDAVSKYLHTIYFNNKQ